jgi:hypothetical protein
MPYANVSRHSNSLVTAVTGDQKGKKNTVTQKLLILGLIQIIEIHLIVII